MTAFTIDDITLIPRPSKVNSRRDVKVHDFLWSAPMDTVTGYATTLVLTKYGHNPVVSRFLPDEEIIRTIRVADEIATEDRPIFFATGLDAKFSTLFQSAGNLNTNKFGVAVDVANGTTTNALQAIEKWRSCGFDNVMSGSICTSTQARDCINAGATHLRVGVGNASACTTRLMTGVGIPNAYAVWDINNFLTKQGCADIKLIADGGVRYPGDVVKYLAIGADGVMMGSVFSKTREAPGWVARDGKLYKTYRGQASASFQQEHYSAINQCPEGVAHKEMKWNGTLVRDVVKLYEGGLRSACTYLNIHDSRDLYTAQWTRVTANAAIEAQPHGLTTRF